MLQARKNTRANPLGEAFKNAGETTIKIPARVCILGGLYAGIGRSLCRHRPVSMPASAGLFAIIGLDRQLYKKTDFGEVAF